MKLDAKQAELLNIQQEVMRSVVISLCALQPERAPAVALALKASASDGRCGPTASKLLKDLSDCLEAFAAEAQSTRH